MIGAYSEERRGAIKELESKINGKIDAIKRAREEIRRLKHEINIANESLNIDFEKLLELDPCLMR